MAESEDTPGPSESVIHRGGCFCRTVTYEVTGSPILSAYCHCTACQRLTACPFTHTIHFPASSFTWTHNSSNTDVLDSYTVPDKPWKTRWRCKRCGTCTASHNSKANKWSIWGAQLDRDTQGRITDWQTLKPTAHIFYGTRMLDIEDRLGKWAGYENQSERY